MLRDGSVAQFLHVFEGQRRNRYVRVGQATIQCLRASFPDCHNFWISAFSGFCNSSIFTSPFR